MIEPGSTAPDFSLPGTEPDLGTTEIRRYRLRDALDGPVVLTFYLFDFNPHCVEHLCSLKSLEWFDLLEDTTVFAVSTDRAFSHRAFAEEYGLDFTLLSDSDGSVSESYGVRYDEFQHHKRVAKRAVFVIDSTRTVRYAWSTDDPETLPEWTAAADVVNRYSEVGPDGSHSTPSHR